MPVCGRTGNQREQKQRDKLREANHADEKRALLHASGMARDGIDLPADRDALGLHG